MNSLFRSEYATKAKEHTMLMDQDETVKMCTAQSISRTEVFDGRTFRPNEPVRTNDSPTTVLFTPNDTVTAALGYPDKMVVLLNFASYKHPGGMFLRGSAAQEEAICHKSNLFNILRDFDGSYYNENRKMAAGNPLYTDRALYTPNVVINNGVFNVHNNSVVTCAAPNLRSPIPMDYPTYKDVLDRRVRFIRDIIYAHPFDVIILGAWGCGVFKNNPNDVMDSFLKAFYPCKELKGKTIVFAVPGINENSDVFKVAPRLYAKMYGGS